MTDHDDGEDDPQLQSLRAVWLAMPDEDPPERGLAALMAAARVKAEEMAKPTLWQRIVALLRRPPIMALATVMVLIGGAVLIGQSGKKMEAEPSLGSPEQTRAHEQVALPPGAAQGSASAVPATDDIGGAPDGIGGAPLPQPANVPALVEEKASGETKPADAAKDTTVAPPTTRRPSTSPKADVARSRSDAKPKATATAKLEQAELGSVRDLEGKGSTGADKNVQLRGGGAAQGALSEGALSDGFAAPPAELASEAPTTKAAEAPRDSDERATATTLSPKAGATASRAPQYVVQAKSAAARGDCAAARLLMKRVAKEDAAAYRKALANDATLNKCVVVAQ